MDLLLVSYLVLWVLVAALVVLMLGVIREIGSLRTHVGIEPNALATADGPKIGAVAPPVRGTDLGGKPITIPAGRRVLLLFISAACAPCRELLPELAAFSRSPAGRDVALCIVGSGSRESLTELEGLFVLPAPILFDDDGSLTRTFEVGTTPYGIALDEDWTVRSKGIPNRRPHLEALAAFRITTQGTRPFVPAPADLEQKGGEVNGFSSAELGPEPRENVNAP